MKTKTKVVSIFLFLLAFMVLVSYGEQKAEWKGRIEKENGVKVIKNPREPLYGNIKFELEEDLSIGNEEDVNYFFYKIWSIQVDKTGNIYVLDSGNHRVQKFDKKGNYLRTIGKKGQGPGEFNMPVGLRVDDETGNIYVNNGFRKIVIFDKEGNYINGDIILEGNLSVFYLDTDRNIWGKSSGPGYNSLQKVNHEGKVEKELAKFPFEMTWKTLSEVRDGDRIRSQSVFITHGYELDLFISKIDNQTFIYAYSKDYELNIIDKEWNIVFKIRKDEPRKKFTAEEKDRIEYRVKSKGIMRGYSVQEISLKFPDHMPFFYSIFTDCRGRIYVRRTPGRSKKKGIIAFDIFSRDGYYLYRASILNHPYIIKNGYLYTCIVNEDTGEELVKRFKIKNWEQIKEGI